MSIPIRAAVALARSAAVVGLIAGSPVLAHAQSRATPAPAQNAPAQNAPAQNAPANSATTSPNQTNSVEQQITQLHSELKITSDQESKWNAVAQAMRDNATNVQKLITQMQQKTPSSMTAVDALEINQQFAQTRLDGLKNFTSAFKSLYESMPDQQKKNADQVLARANRPANHNG